MLNKKYLIASGCSFTEGHILKEKGSWATYFAKKYNLELINLGKGGAGNQYILSNVIQYSKIEKEIADNAIFGIQLSEVLRTMMCFTFPKSQYNQGMFWHITPVQFIYEETFDNWDLNNFHNKWIYDNRNALAPFFINVTHSVLLTINSLLSFIDFCELNKYPYFIFDGLNKCIPEKINDKDWYLTSNNNIDKHIVNVQEDDIDSQYFFKDVCLPKIHKSIIDCINKNPYYLKNIVLKDYLLTEGWLISKEYEIYFDGNEGHPNELGCKKWIEYLELELFKLFGKSE